MRACLELETEIWKVMSTSMVVLKTSSYVPSWYWFTYLFQSRDPQLKFNNERFLYFF
jgi:hypothetical protein